MLSRVMAALINESLLQVNETDHQGQTALHSAAQGGRVGVARFLLSNGADQNMKTAAGQDVEAVSTQRRRGGRILKGERGEGKKIASTCVTFCIHIGCNPSRGKALAGEASMQ